MTDDQTNEHKRSGKSANSSGKVPYRDVKWFNPSPNTGDLAWLEDNGDELGSLLLRLFDAVSAQERLSFKFDDKSNRWMAVLFAGNGDEPNAGYALSVRGATPFDSGVLLAYFHLVKYSGDWQVSGGGNDGRWG